MGFLEEIHLPRGSSMLFWQQRVGRMDVSSPIAWTTSRFENSVVWCIDGFEAYCCLWRRPLIRSFTTQGYCSTTCASCWIHDMSRVYNQGQSACISNDRKSGGIPRSAWEAAVAKCDYWCDTQGTLGEHSIQADGGTNWMCLVESQSWREPGTWSSLA